MRVTRVIAANIRGPLSIKGIELKKSLELVVYSEVERVKVISDEFGIEVLGWNLEDGLGRMFLELFRLYYEYKDRESLSQAKGPTLSEEEDGKFRRLAEYF